MIKSQDAFRQFIESQGWEVYRGFPDYFCRRNGEFILVEVKGSTHESLERRQLMVATALTSVGVKCLRWSPDTAMLMPFDSMPADKRRALREEARKEKARQRELRKATHKRQATRIKTTRQGYPSAVHPAIPLAVQPIDKAAALLGLTPAGVYWLIQEGKIQANTVAGKLVIADTEIERLKRERAPLEEQPDA